MTRGWGRSHPWGGQKAWVQAWPWVRVQVESLHKQEGRQVWCQYWCAGEGWGGLCWCFCFKRKRKQGHWCSVMTRRRCERAEQKGEGVESCVFRGRRAKNRGAEMEWMTALDPLEAVTWAWSETSLWFALFQPHWMWWERAGFKPRLGWPEIQWSKIGPSEFTSGGGQRGKI